MILKKLMKQGIIGSLFLLFGEVSNAQLNLIPDPSFEDTTNNIQPFGQIALQKWKNLDSTKLLASQFVYFSYYSQNSSYILPSNPWCFQYPRHGGGVSVFDMIWAPSSFYKRSLARCKLNNKLIAGKMYCSKMYVNPCERYCGFYTDAIQMYFDNGQLDTIVAIDSVGPYTFVTPQVSNPVGFILNDTANWTLISGTFISNGNEEYLTIGNFKSDNGSVKVFNPSTFIPPDTVFLSSLLVDDVSIIPIDASNWLHDTTCIMGDSVFIGLPIYEEPDAIWYDINMNYLGKGSGIKVKPVQWATKYIQQIDLCGIIRSDTLTVWAAPDGLVQLGNNDKINLEIYPNPVTDNLIIRTKSNEEKEVFNYIGQLIYSTKENKIDVSRFVKGIYYLKCGTYVKKFVVN